MNGYKFKEEFDVNLSLCYENDNWQEWHILREFISNALDGVGNDKSRVSIEAKDGFIRIKDLGSGYPLVYAKRIGASSKKDDPSSIGQFGEGTKLALLTCLRLNIKVTLASRNWLIEPKIVPSEGQEVLMYDIYESAEPICGSIVTIEATDEVMDIINRMDEYFLLYSKDECLHGDILGGIYSSGNKLYNKGVYIKDIKSLFSYGISIERLNRDRDTISDSDIAYRVKDIWRDVDSISTIKKVLELATLGSSDRERYIEFYNYMTTKYAYSWADAFKELYGERAVIATDDFASREAMALGYVPVEVEYGIGNLLKSGGILEDINCLARDYEFVWSKVGCGERDTLNKLSGYAGLVGFDVPSEVKVFDEYINHEDIQGLYDGQSGAVMIRKEVLDSDLSNALRVYLHELNHYNTGADDIHREFADNLCVKLSNLLIRYADEVGIEVYLVIDRKGIELPADFSYTANDMTAKVIVYGDTLIINTAGKGITAKLPYKALKDGIWERNITIYNGKFVVTLPKQLLEIIGDEIKCSIKS